MKWIKWNYYSVICRHTAPCLTPSHVEPQSYFLPCWQLWTPSGNAKNGKNRHSLGGVVLGVLQFFRNGGNENSTCISKQKTKYSTRNRKLVVPKIINTHITAVILELKWQCWGGGGGESFAIDFPIHFFPKMSAAPLFFSVSTPNPVQVAGVQFCCDSIRAFSDGITNTKKIEGCEQRTVGIPGASCIRFSWSDSVPFVS